jgi:hypothetical protein
VKSKGELERFKERARRMAKDSPIVVAFDPTKKLELEEAHHLFSSLRGVVSGIKVGLPALFSMGLRALELPRQLEGFLFIFDPKLADVGHVDRMVAEKVFEAGFDALIVQPFRRVRWRPRGGRENQGREGSVGGLFHEPSRFGGIPEQAHRGVAAMFLVGGSGRFHPSRPKAFPHLSDPIPLSGSPHPLSRRRGSRCPSWLCPFRWCRLRNCGKSHLILAGSEKGSGENLGGNPCSLLNS